MVSPVSNREPSVDPLELRATSIVGHFLGSPTWFLSRRDCGKICGVLTPGDQIVMDNVTASILEDRVSSCRSTQVEIPTSGFVRMPNRDIGSN